MRRATVQARVMPSMRRPMSRLTGSRSRGRSLLCSLSSDCALYLRLHHQASRPAFVSAIEGKITVYNFQALSAHVNPESSRPLPDKSDDYMTIDVIVMVNMNVLK
jgi:hypothetical protein